MFPRFTTKGSRLHEISLIKRLHDLFVIFKILFFYFDFRVCALVLFCCCFALVASRCRLDLVDYIQMHCLGTEGQRVLATLDVPQQQPTNDEQQPAEAQQYQRIVSELTAHFGTQATVITERHRFRQRSQAAGETIN